jgi:hypothetical protein
MPTPIPDFDARTAKSRFNTRLYNERRADEFIIIREQLKAEGVPDRLAWKIAGLQFPPLDGSPLEYDTTGLGEKVIAMATEKLPGTNPSVFEDSAPQTHGELHDIPGQPGADDPMAVHPPKPKTTYAHGVARAVAELTGAWRSLAQAVDPKKRANMREIAMWVFANALTPPEAIDPTEVPGTGAIRLLKFVQSSENNYKDFLMGFASKLLPSKGELDAAERFSDDGREIFSMLEDFEASLEEAA